MQVLSVTMAQVQLKRRPSSLGPICMVLAEMGMWEMALACLLFSAILSMILMGMARTKADRDKAAREKAEAQARAQAVKKRKGRENMPAKKRAASSSASQDRGKRPVSEDEPTEDTGEEQREVPAPKTWAIAVAKKPFICERGVVEHDFMSGGSIYQAIELHRIGFLYKEVEGYYPQMVREFYTHLHDFVDSPGEMRTLVYGKVVVVSADHIARVMGYVRPPIESDPYPPRELPTLRPEVLVPIVYREGLRYTGRFVPGSFKHDFAFMNKLIHYTLAPGGNEKKPSASEVTFLLEVMNHGVIDFAALVFSTMRDLHGRYWTASLPYPCLVTKLCQEQEVRHRKGEKFENPPFGPLMKATKHKSETMAKKGEVSQAPAPAAPHASPPDSPPAARSKGSPLHRLAKQIKGWFKCVLGKQRSLDRKIAKMDHRMARMEHRLAGGSEESMPIHPPSDEEEYLSDELDQYANELEEGSESEEEESEGSEE